MPPTIERGKIISEGKTKIIFDVVGDMTSVLVVSKDDITAGDGAKHDVIEGKAEMATATTCNVFQLLNQCDVPTAFRRQVDRTSFLADRCTMLPYEVVVRREAHGSALKRLPWLAKGHVFPKLVLEFFLKTSGRKWKDHDLPCDDPLMIVVEDEIHLFEPSKPVNRDAPFLKLRFDEVFTLSNELEMIEKMGRIAKTVFRILEKSWSLVGGRLVDFKLEFGINASGELVLADVVDNDSWRVVQGDEYIDKQSYRDGGELSDVTRKYFRVVELTSQFRRPNQQLIIWTGSDKDDITPFVRAVSDLIGELSLINPIVCSLHKQPVRAMEKLYSVLQLAEQSVIIAFVGMSNGAGPTLSAATTTPVITLPALSFPEDIWSSLRTPSNVPVTTVLNPANAVLAALNILAINNPLIYAMLQEKLEERLTNFVTL